MLHHLWTSLKSTFDVESLKVWSMAFISTASTALSWLNVINATLTTFVIIGTLIYTWRRAFKKDV